MNRRLPTRFERSGIRLFQMALAAPLLLAEHNPLAALLVIGILEWMLRHDWSRPTVRGLTEEEWKKVHEEARQQEEFEQYVEQHVLIPRPHE
jgi:hypothetical protein